MGGEWKRRAGGGTAGGGGQVRVGAPRPGYGPGHPSGGNTVALSVNAGNASGRRARREGGTGAGVLGDHVGLSRTPPLKARAASAARAPPRPEKGPSPSAVPHWPVRGGGGGRLGGGRWASSSSPAGVQASQAFTARTGVHCRTSVLLELGELERRPGAPFSVPAWVSRDPPSQTVSKNACPLLLCPRSPHRRRGVGIRRPRPHVFFVSQKCTCRNGHTSVTRLLSFHRRVTVGVRMQNGPSPCPIRVPTCHSPRTPAPAAADLSSTNTVLRPRERRGDGTAVCVARGVRLPSVSMRTPVSSCV